MGPDVPNDVGTRVADWMVRALVVVLLFAGYLTWLGDSPVPALLFGFVVALLVRAWFRRPWAIDNRRGTRTTIVDVDLMTGREFQQLIAGLMRRDSFEGVRVTGLRDDLSMDVLGSTPAGHRVVVQCNRDAPHRRVDTSDVERLLGSAQDEHAADVAVLVTTGRFTRAAIALNERRDVVLLDRSQVAAWMTGRATQLTPYLAAVAQ